MKNIHILSSRIEKQAESAGFTLVSSFLEQEELGSRYRRQARSVKAVQTPWGLWHYAIQGEQLEQAFKESAVLS